MTFAPSQVQAQSGLGAKAHGILSQVVIFNDSHISLGEQKVTMEAPPAPILALLDFAKTVRPYLKIF